MGNFSDSGSTNLTALAGGGQTGATLLSYGINRIGTVATLGDSVMLPPALQGTVVVVINRGAQPCQVFGNNTYILPASPPNTNLTKQSDTINGIASSTGIAQGVNTSVTYICSVAGNWERHLDGAFYASPITIGASGALNPHTPATYVLNKAGVAAMTLAAPTAGTDDGIEITITSDTAQAHTVTATGLLDTGSASVNVATFAAQKGAGLTLMAFNARWKVLCSVGITFS